MDEASDDSSDEGICIMRKALDVELPADFDPNKIPENGEEYLHHVMYEARNCESWVTANIDRSKFAKNQTFHVTLQEGCKKAPKSMVPSIEWQQKKLDEFASFRKYVLSKITEEPRNTAVHNSHFEKRITFDIPTFTEISKLTQDSKLKVLNIILQHLEELQKGSSFHYSTGIWLYSLLATLDIPLCPSAYHLLRELARQCALVRSRLPEDAPEEIYLPLNLYICLISRYFNQLDLADD